MILRIYPLLYFVFFTVCLCHNVSWMRPLSMKKVRRKANLTYTMKAPILLSAHLNRYKLLIFKTIDTEREREQIIAKIMRNLGCTYFVSKKLVDQCIHMGHAILRTAHHFEDANHLRCVLSSADPPIIAYIVDTSSGKILLAKSREK